MKAIIRAVAYHLPDRLVTNKHLAECFTDWNTEKIEAATGIGERRVAGPEECASDLACSAAEILFANGFERKDVDFILFCTQTPDYLLPASACILQDRLGIPTSAGALDFNLGCSGYVYGLGLAKGMVESGQARTVLLLTGDTLTKYVHTRDKSSRTLFGDAGSATLIAASDTDADSPGIGPVIFGTDGSGADNLIVRTSALRSPKGPLPAKCTEDEHGYFQSDDYLYMNGGEIFAFTIKVVPAAVRQLLDRAQLSLDQVDLFVFHQANKFLLQHLQKKLKIPGEKFVLALREFGNTSSCTIPIALETARREGRLRPGQLAMLVGFGVGCSWAAALVRWQ